jgi:hypothetical protein
MLLRLPPGPWVCSIKRVQACMLVSVCACLRVHVYVMPCDFVCLCVQAFVRAVLEVENCVLFTCVYIDTEAFLAKGLHDMALWAIKELSDLANAHSPSLRP